MAASGGRAKSGSPTAPSCRGRRLGLGGRTGVPQLALDHHVTGNGPRHLGAATAVLDHHGAGLLAVIQAPKVEQRFSAPTAYHPKAEVRLGACLPYRLRR